MMFYSTAHADSFDHDSFDDEPDVDAEPMSVIGKAIAMYQFEGKCWLNV